MQTPIKAKHTTIIMPNIMLSIFLTTIPSIILTREQNTYISIIQPIIFIYYFIQNILSKRIIG